MPIFRKSNLLFIHIPKTAGTSIEKHFYQLEASEDQYTSQSLFSTDLENQKIKGYSLQHYTFLDMMEKFGEDRINQFKTIFSVVRNPYDRMVSEFHYYYTQVQPINPSLDLLTNEELQSKFEQFCIHCFNEEINNDNHHALQYSFLINQKKEIDTRIHILKYENLDQEFKQLFGCSLPYRELYSNRTLPCHVYYNENSQQLVADYYRSDFILFWYDPNHLP